MINLGWFSLPGQKWKLRAGGLGAYDEMFNVSACFMHIDPVYASIFDYVNRKTLCHIFPWV